MDADNLRFNTLRNALYHTARRRHYEGVARYFNLFVILLGTAAVSDMLGVYGITQAQIGAAVAIVGALQLVFDFGRQARDHQVLQRDYYRLLAEIEADTEPTTESLAQWRGEMMLITADEPPVLRAVDAKAYNDALDASGVYPLTERLRIPWYQRLLGRFLSFEGFSYKKLSESS
ncbi:hypothetical protein [Amaricoccus solimangrovi]|uniref:SMODS and SLOG-associating 2TM effector domain-containing protein n=1 Tax=Amaricoccus solimangrovi TaxID=2589815 RepID=A0A501W655_9RHOB|nr:hypothetical protein [Amaricoccus solimangrovi]TPE45079.1 hypothetical protein FJM51_22790 [Amaricoccus solimangrovi]